MAKHGHRWWEFDITYIQIRVLEKLGLIWNVVHDVPGRKLHAEVGPRITATDRSRDRSREAQGTYSLGFRVFHPITGSLPACDFARSVLNEPASPYHKPS